MIKKLSKAFALSEQGAKGFIIACATCAVSDMALMFPVGLLFMLIKDLLTGVPPIDKIAFYGLGIIACLVLIVVTNVFKYNSTYGETYKESGVRRITISEHLRKLPLSFFGKKDLSDLTSTIMADCSFIEKIFSHYIPDFFGAVLSTLLISISLFSFDVSLAIAVFWVVPISFGIVLLAVRLYDNLGEKQMAAKLAAAAGIQECLETMRDLKSNNAEKKYLEGLTEKFKAVEKRLFLSECGTAVVVVSSQMILKIGIATVALVGSISLVSGRIDIFTFLMFLLVASRIYDPLQATLQNLAAMLMCRTSIGRMKEILNFPKQEGAENLSNKGYDITFDKVAFSYNNSETVLKNVSFTAKQGEVTALVGPSGGGKTTAARLCSRFWDCTSGKITVGGMNIGEIDPETLLSLYAIVFQDVSLFNNTIMENIRIGRKNATDEEVIAAAKMANCDEFAKKLPSGYQTQIGENGSNLSGGERQRISIARAMLKNAPIILLDEATASLDVENETAIQTALSRLIQNKTVLVIAHRMRTVAGADKIVVLKDGVIAEQGTPQELLHQNGVFKHMADLQAAGQSWVM